MSIQVSRASIISILALVFYVLCLGCGNSSGSAGSGGASPPPSSPPPATPDTTPPTAGTAMTISNLTAASLTVNWGAGFDSVTSQPSLQYRLVKASSNAAISSVALVDAIAAGPDLLLDYTANVTTKNLTGLTGGTTYYFAVVVKDAAGNATLYTPVNATTLVTPVAGRVYGQYGNFTGNTQNPGGPNSLNSPYNVAVDATGTYVVDTVNNRVLYYSGTSTTAARVYGQNGNLSGNAVNNGGISANSLFQPAGIAVDATGVYIADTVNNRVLFYPGISTTATRVYGQGGNFTLNIPNNGGVSANSLSAPTTVAIDASGVYIADRYNHRVLFYSGTSTTATRVYGHAGSFTAFANNDGGLSANSLYQPLGVAVDSGGVYISDTANNRVLYYAGTSTTATRVYGQGGSFTANSGNSGGISANSLITPFYLAADATGVYVSDNLNHRILYFAGTSTTATRVYGQGGSFTVGGANNGGVSANSLNNTYGVAVDATGVYIADAGNHRVLYYAGTSTTATRVYGQGGNFASNTINYGAITADSLYSPSAVLANAGGIYLSEFYNHRVLYYSGTSTTASRIYGQGGSFALNASNNGGISANSLNYPAGLAEDAGGIYIADQLNHRVLYYSGTSTTASRVYGQAGSFTTGSINNGGISPTSLYCPAGIATDAGGVYIVDQNNHRVLYFSGTSTTATRVYGQGGSFATGTNNNGGISANSLNFPVGVALDATGVYIADQANSRVLYYAGTSTTATRVYGQGGSFATGTNNKGGISANSLSAAYAVAATATGVYIADSSNHRALYFPGTSTTATVVYGQAGLFTTNTGNNGGVSASSLLYPQGIAVYSGGVYVADTTNNRALMY